MADRVYPSAKQNINGANPAFPATNRHRWRYHLRPLPPSPPLLLRLLPQNHNPKPHFVVHPRHQHQFKRHGEEPEQRTRLLLRSHQYLAPHERRRDRHWQRFVSRLRAWDEEHDAVENDHKGNSQALDDASASKIKSEMKSKSGLPLKIKLETKMKVKMGAIKSPKVRIRVSCDGIRATVPTGKTATTASTSNAKCKVDWRIKIWKWTF
ncbi:hypothetical protein Patl1_33516 [Pistacia atlantica]|uniref:Uncharacterized protein n=1 Tax=Pistacia atlantica TaxID=434234 RepID=A0ACC0ZSD5_9ROSI|nr:hypothetical protein Patl1_33516 [Pistacia atlantica]